MGLSMHLGMMYTMPTLLDLFKYINENPTSREVFGSWYQQIIPHVHGNTMQPNVDVHDAEASRTVAALMILDNLMEEADNTDVDFTSRSHAILRLPSLTTGASLSQRLNARPPVTPSLVYLGSALDLAMQRYHWIEKDANKASQSAGAGESFQKIRMTLWEKMLTDLVVESYFDNDTQAAEKAVSPLLGQLSMGRALCEVLIFV